MGNKTSDSINTTADIIEKSIYSPPALKETLEENLIDLKEIQQQGESLLLIMYWNIGRILSGMLKNSKYGDNILGEAAEELDIGKITLQHAVKLYNDFNAQNDIENLIKNNLNWSMMKQVQRLSKPEDRSNVIESIKAVGEIQPVTVSRVSIMVNDIKIRQGHQKSSKQYQKNNQSMYDAQKYFKELNKELIKFESASYIICNQLNNSNNEFKTMFELFVHEDCINNSSIDYIKLCQDVKANVKNICLIMAELQSDQFSLLMTNLEKVESIKPTPKPTEQEKSHV